MKAIRTGAYFLADWLRPGIKCSSLPPEAGPNGEQIVLIHGLLHRSWIMRDFARFLAGAGYAVHVFDYRSTRGTLARHADALRRYLTTLPAVKTHFVTHSMGGLVLRRMFAGGGIHLPLGRAVLIAPPNHGSPVASRWLKCFPPSRKLVLPLSELSDNPDSPLAELPELSALPFSVIASTCDRMVPLESTHLRGESSHHLVAHGHAYLVNQEDVRTLVLRLLKTPDK